MHYQIDPAKPLTPVGWLMKSEEVEAAKAQADNPYLILTPEEHDDYLIEHARGEWNKLVEVDQERYWEMLEVLPPENWTKGALIETFNMCEYTSGTWTGQFASVKIDGEERFFNREVHALDRSTWITYEEVVAFIKEGQE